jgi:hypothetical protein
MKIPNRIVLKLNADWSPHQMTPWQEIVPLLLEGTVSTVTRTGFEEDEEIYRWEDGSPILIRSGPGEDGVTPKVTIRMPAVVILKKYISVSRRRVLSPSRHNILARESYLCGYCLTDRSHTASFQGRVDLVSKLHCSLPSMPIPETRSNIG